MSEFLSRFTFQPSKMTSEIWMIASAIWLAVLICTVVSITGQPFSKKQRAIWIVIVVCIPILGLLAYLPFSIRRDELPTAFLMRGTSKDSKKNQGRLAPPRKGRPKI